MSRIFGGLMVRADRPSFETWFPSHLERTLPLLDHYYVRVDRPGAERVIPFLDHPKIEWEYQNKKPTHHHSEERERQAILDKGFEWGADWMVVLDSDEVLEQGAAEVLREFIDQDPPYNGFRLPLTYSSHHREGYVLDWVETNASADRIFRLDEHMRGYRYHSDGDGLHCGSIPDVGKKIGVLKEIVTVHYHATTPEEWAMKRAFYADTVEVKRFWADAEFGAYPECGDPPYSCDRFGAEANAVPLESRFTDRDERFKRLFKRSPASRGDPVLI